MKVRIDDDGRVALPEALLEKLGVSPGRSLEARVERGRLILAPLPPDGDPFAQALQKPADDAFEKALEQESEAHSRALDAFDEALRRPQVIDFEKEKEDRERWRD